ncbi:pyridoxine 5'-phosphate synthase [bacterium]|nr:pyridoxine 5'-phosphate synthase [bacterium]
MTTLFSINFNKIALLRNSRGRDYPSVQSFARRAVELGVGGLTLHPRPDQRHARYSDVFDLKALCLEFPGTELNIEGYPTSKFLDIVIEAQADQCTLVPDAPDQITSDHGWDIQKNGDMLKPIIKRLQREGIRVSLFMDPDPEQIELVKSTGTDRIELYTEEYADSFHTDQCKPVLEKYEKAATHAHSLGLGVNAGHDLNLENLARFLTIDGIKEVSIGHAVIVESLLMGFDNVVRQYLEIVKQKG